MFNFSFLLASSFDDWLPILLIVGMFVLLYFFMIKPQKKREREDAAMRDAVQVGDEITTIGGIIGKVISVKGETFVLETTKDKTKIRFLKGAIRSVDVRAADLAAAILETKEADVASDTPEDGAIDFMTESIPAEDAAVEATAEETVVSKRAARKARRQQAAAAAAAAMGNGNAAQQDAPAVEEPPVVEDAPVATEETAPAAEFSDIENAPAAEESATEENA